MGILHKDTIDGVEEDLASSNSDILQLEEKERQFRLNLSDFASEEDHMHLHDLEFNYILLRTCNYGRLTYVHMHAAHAAATFFYIERSVNSFKRCSCAPAIRK